MRFTKITIDGIKNVEHGEIVFSKGLGPNGIDITGIYGPNGSGKTTLVECIKLLQSLVREAPYFGEELNDEPDVVVPADDLRNLISAGLQSACVTFELAKTNDAGTILERFKYEIRIDAIDEQNARIALEALSHVVVGEGRMRCIVSVEREGDEVGVVRGSGVRRGKGEIPASGETSAIFRSTQTVVDCFGPAARAQVEYVIQELQYFATERLFILTCEAMEQSEHGLLPQYIRTGREAGRIMTFLTRIPVVTEAPPRELDYALFERCQNGENVSREIITHTNKSAGSIVAYSRDSKLQTAILDLPASRNPGLLNEGYIIDAFESINPLIDQLVSGLSIGYEPIPQSRILGVVPGEYESDPSFDIRYLLLKAHRGQESWQLWQESKGVLKLISIASFLRAVCVDPDMTVVIDELDANIFEYLLGQILEIVHEEGCGQLIFTAHNLRPLEKLNPGCIVFTCTDVHNRFVRLKNVKRTNNLRKMYLRDVYLNPKDTPEFCKVMSKDRMAFALTDAGVY